MIDGLENWRESNQSERALLMHLLRGDVKGKAEILEQISSMEVMQISPTGSLRLRSPGPLAIVKDIDAPSPRANDNIIVEGFYDDEDPSQKNNVRIARLVRLALHVTDGRISELEVYKEDGSPILTSPFEIDLSKVHFY
jgi:hypothetical protein